MPAMRKRVRQFCAQYDTDGPFDVLWRFIEINFVADDPNILLLAAVDDAGEIVGHALLACEESLGQKVVLVRQLQTDGLVPRDHVRQWVGHVEGWAKSKGAKELRCIALDSRRAKLFQRLYGFQGERVIMSRPIPGV